MLFDRFVKVNGEKARKSVGGYAVPAYQVSDTDTSKVYVNYVLVKVPSISLPQVIRACS